MTEQFRQATAEEVERSKSDPLFIMLMLRHRMREEKQFEPGAHRMTLSIDDLPSHDYGARNFELPGHHDHTGANNVARSIPIYERELEIMLEHFTTKAADLERMAANLKVLDTKLGEAYDEIKRLRTLPEGWIVEAQEDQGYEIERQQDADLREEDSLAACLSGESSITGYGGSFTVYHDSHDKAEALLALLLENLLS